MSDKKRESNTVPLAAGDRVGAYRIERPLGSGGMAEVYYAIHEDLERPAAIKVLRASLATDDVHLQRFMQEARAAASLVHPNIVQVYDVGRDGEHRYIAQEYIPGVNLRQYLNIDETQQEPSRTTHVKSEANGQTRQSGAQDRAADSDLTAEVESARAGPTERQLPLTETLSILLQVLAALTKSANSGIVHRDIKPENIMLTPDGDVKVADFGLARILLGNDPQLTRAGTTLGTPMYMSPEQIQEGQVDIRSDLYSLGATLYHMLAGTPPYTGETPLALAMKHVQAEIPDIRDLRADLPESIYQLVSRLLAKSPKDRFAHPAEVLSFLKQHRADDLAADWPEQTVPLPGATSKDGSGSMRATLLLQAKLRKLRGDRRHKILVQLGVSMLLVTGFVLGCAVTFERPFDLMETTSSEVFNGIERQASVQQQYDMALLRKDLHPIYKWEAVRHYFNPNQRPTSERLANRVYTGLASLQWAAALQFRGEYRQAEEVLDRTINDPEMEDLYVALAYLQKADGACWEDFEKNKSAIDSYIDAARELVKRESDRELLRAGVQLMDDRVKKRLFPSEDVES